MRVKIFVVSHKLFRMPPKHYLQPILVGRKDFSMPGAVRDDAGENIAGKNYCFCELTALYSIWKNYMHESDYIGLCHYRRFFGKHKIGLWNQLPDEKKLARLLGRYDVILPEPYRWKKTVGQMYSDANGFEKDLQTVGQVIRELYPEYSGVYRSILTAREASYCNMFIMKREMADAYCKWLFAILFEAEKRIDISGYSPAEARIFGYLSEILLNVWVKRNGYSCKYLPMLITDRPFMEKIKAWAKQLLRR